MIRRRKSMFTTLTLLVLLMMGASVFPVKAEGAARQMEALNRGLVAVKTDGGIFVSWRFLGTENASVTFNVYRDGQKLNASPVKSTNYIDKNGTAGSSYSIRAVVNGTEQAAAEKASVWAQPYHSVPLDKPAGGTTPKGEAYTYSANDASTGDVDGDGQYELILKWDPSIQRTIHRTAIRVKCLLMRISWTEQDYGESVSAKTSERAHTTLSLWCMTWMVTEKRKWR